MTLIEGIAGLLGHTALAGGVPAAYSYYDHVAIARWEDYKNAQQERGEIIDLAKLLDTAPVPEERNFASHPLLAELFEDPAPADPAIAKLTIRTIEGLGWDDERARQHHGWLAAEAKLIEAAAPEGVAPRRLASYILGCIEPHRAALDSLSAAAARPHSRFPVDWEETFAARTPHYTALQGVSRTLELDAVAAVRSGEGGRALLDAATLVRIANHLEEEHALIGFLVQIAIRSIGYQVIWEGLRARIWDDDDLLRLDRILAEADVDLSFTHAMRGERATMSKGITDFGEGRVPGGAGQALGAPRVLSILPRGLWYENAHALCLLLDRAFFSRPNYPGCTIPKYDDAFVEQQLESWKTPFRPDRLLIMVAFPVLSSTSARGLQAEAHLRLARTAIALERYKLRHRKYPTTLADLVPIYLAEMPVCPVTGDTLLYAIREGETPAIWSNGFDGKDDGGRPKQRHLLGDWVWQYELPAGYGASDYRSSDPLK